MELLAEQVETAEETGETTDISDVETRLFTVVQGADGIAFGAGSLYHDSPGEATRYTFYIEDDPRIQRIEGEEGALGLDMTVTGYNEPVEIVFPDWVE